MSDALHRLRHPVGVGELLERVEMRVLDERNRIELELGAGDVGQLDVLDQHLRAGRHEQRDLGAHARDLGHEAAVAETDAALVVVERCRAWARTTGATVRRPSAVCRRRYSVWPLSCELGSCGMYLVMRLRAGSPLHSEQPARVIHEAAEAQRAHVVDPLDRSLRIFNHVLAGAVVEMTVLHGSPGIAAEEQRKAAGG